MENMDNNKEFIYEEKYSHPYNIALNLTNDCNLACKYCFVEQKPQYMTLDIAIKAVEYLMENLYLHHEIYKDIAQNELGSIWFFGGEPLLCFNTIIKPLIEYCEQKKYLDKIYFSLTTNATLLTKDKVEFLKKYNIIPMLSIDGIPKVQDYNRPCKNSNIKSSELIQNNIPIILENFPNISFRSTIYKPTMKYLFQNYLYAESLGFKQIILTPDTKQTDWIEEDYNILEEQFSQIFTYRLLQYKNNYMPISFSNLNQVYKQILEHDIYYTKSLLKDLKTDYLQNCGLGVRQASIDFEGKIFTCQERPSRHNNKSFLLGDLENGIDFENHKLFLQEYLTDIKNIGFHNLNPKLCINCLFKNNCTYSCISTSFDLSNDYVTLNENLCRYEQLLTKFALNTMDILVQEKNKMFYLYLLKNLQLYQETFYNLLEMDQYFC